VKISVVGAGNVGGALARSWHDAGHSVMVGARDQQSPKVRATVAGMPDMQVADVHTAVARAEVLLVATPAAAVMEVIDAVAAGYREGLVVIDATNSVAVRPGGYDNATAAFTDKLPNVRVVKCFNTVGFEVMVNPIIDGIVADMFMAGDDIDAKTAVRTLALDAGFGECFDVGGADAIPSLEHMAMVWIRLAMRQGYGRSSGWKLLRSGS